MVIREFGQPNCKMSENTLIGIKGLVQAIIIRAIQDYFDSRRQQDKYSYVLKQAYPKEKDMTKYTLATQLRHDVEKFLKSQWFELMCEYDGNKILENLRKEYENGRKNSME